MFSYLENWIDIDHSTHEQGSLKYHRINDLFDYIGYFEVGKLIEKGNFVDKLDNWTFFISFDRCFQLE